MNKSFILGLIAVFMAASFGVYYFFAREVLPEPETETRVAVYADKIQRMTMRDYIVAYGSVEVEPGSDTAKPASVRITAPSGGIIAEVNCIEGQRVNKGDMLFRLDSRLVDLAIEKARQDLLFAEKNFERQNKLQQIDGTSDKLYLEAKQSLEKSRAELANTKAQLSLLTVPAPFAGTIVDLNVNTGQAVDMAQQLATLLDLERLVITTSIPSREISRLKTGQQVEINTTLSNVDSVPKTQSLTGTLTYIAPQVDEKTDTVTVRTSVPGSSKLRAGQFVKIRIITEVRPDCLVVPRESVYTDHAGVSTLSIIEADVARQKVVKTGLRDGNFIQVEADGLAEGTAVVTLGSYALPGETKVDILTSGTGDNK
jgi:membrane fusion protein (multidrug efflux system)